MVRCIGGAKMTMTATVLSRNVAGATGEGTYTRYQDPDSNEISLVFVPAAAGPTTVQAQYDIPCYARGYTDLGFRSSAQREIYLKGDYGLFEAIEFTFPAKYDKITRQSYVTNIRDQNEVTLWKEEETNKATTFQVQGVTPVFDPFGKLREWTAVLVRADIQ